MSEPPGDRPPAAVRGRWRRLAPWGLGLVLVLAGAAVANRQALGAAVARRIAPTWPVPDVDPTGMTPNVADALAAARRAVLDAPASHAAWYELASVLHAHALDAQAITAYRRASALRPDDPRPYYLQAILLPGEGGRDEAAQSLFERTTRLDPHYPPAWLRLGQLLARSGRTEEAIAALERAVALDPAYPMAQRDLGAALLTAGDTAGALRHLSFAAHLEPDDYPTWAALSRAFRQAGRDDEAEAAAQRSMPLVEVAGYRDSVLDAVMAHGVGPVRLERQADEYLRAGAWAQAIETLKRVERDLPGSAAIQRKLADAYAGAGEAELAAAHRRRAEALDGRPDAAPP